MIRRFELPDKRFAATADLLPAPGKRGGRWNDHLVVDGHGIPLAATISAGQAPERERLAATLEAVRLPNGKGRPTCRPSKLAGDKGYRCPAVRAYLRRRGILPVIPTRKDQRSNPRFDKAVYRQRNVIERGVGWLKENRPRQTAHLPPDTPSSPSTIWPPSNWP